MNRIEAVSNPRIVAACRALARGERMPIEGDRMLAEMLEAGETPEEVFFVEEGHEEKERKHDQGEHDQGENRRGLLRKVIERGGRTFQVSGRVLRKLSDLPSARGVVALARVPSLSLSDLLPSKKSLVVLLDGVQDPANVGAIVRSSEAFGVSSVVVLSGSASPFSARSLRASAGSALRVPIVFGISASSAVAWARAAGFTLAGAEAHGGELPEAVALVRPLVLVIGSEGHGLSPEVSSAVTRRLTIPLEGRVESLNAAVAAALLLHALSRGTR